MEEKNRNYKLKKFKFPIDLIEFPIKYSKQAVTKKMIRVIKP